MEVTEFSTANTEAHKAFSYGDYKTASRLYETALKLAPDDDSRLYCRKQIFESNQRRTSDAYKVVWTSVIVMCLCGVIGGSLVLCLKYAQWFILFLGSVAYVCILVGLIWWLMFHIFTKEERSLRI